MFMGLLGELMMRIYYETQGRKPYVVRKVIPPFPFDPFQKGSKWKSLLTEVTENADETIVKQGL
ncbi:MAG: hypothetical protein JO215_04545 [Ktedonobacteraceae bacterium]|nr:hypothetical protein [Ktedonobacteraceae bacterium]